MATGQAADLSGMLSQIAGTLGQGYQIGGQNAGAAIGDMIATSAAPQVDMSNPDSLDAYANWAQRNGQVEVAAQYRAAAMKQRTELGKVSYKKRIGQMQATAREILARRDMAPEEQRAGFDAAYQTLLTKMDDYGAADPNGIGDEGTNFELKLGAERAAVKKAAQEAENRRLTAISKANEIKDYVNKGKKMPAEMFAGSGVSYEQYESAYDSAISAEAGGHGVNEQYRKLLQTGLEESIKPKPMSGRMAAVVLNEAANMEELGSMVEYLKPAAALENTDEGKLAAAIQKNVQENLKGIESVAKEDQPEYVRAAILKALRAYLPDEYEDAREDLKSESSAAGRDQIVSDVNLREQKTIEGEELQMGSDTYNRLLEKAKQNPNFDKAAFDEAWSRRVESMKTKSSARSQAERIGNRSYL